MEFINNFQEKLENEMVAMNNKIDEHIEKIKELEDQIKDKIQEHQSAINVLGDNISQIKNKLNAMWKDTSDIKIYWTNDENCPDPEEDNIPCNCLVVVLSEMDFKICVPAMGRSKYIDELHMKVDHAYYNASGSTLQKHIKSFVEYLCEYIEKGMIRDDPEMLCSSEENQWRFSSSIYLTRILPDDALIRVIKRLDNNNFRCLLEDKIEEHVCEFTDNFEWHKDNLEYGDWDDDATYTETVYPEFVCLIPIKEEDLEGITKNNIIEETIKNLN